MIEELELAGIARLALERARVEHLIDLAHFAHLVVGEQVAARLGQTRLQPGVHGVVAGNGAHRRARVGHVVLSEQAQGVVVRERVHVAQDEGGQRRLLLHDVARGGAHVMLLVLAERVRDEEAARARVHQQKHAPDDRERHVVRAEHVRDGVHLEELEILARVVERLPHTSERFVHFHFFFFFFFFVRSFFLLVFLFLSKTDFCSVRVITFFVVVRC